MPTRSWLMPCALGNTVYMQTHILWTVSVSPRQCEAHKSIVMGNVDLSAMSSSKVTPGLWHLERTVDVCFFGTLRLPRIPSENCKEECFPCIQTLSFRWTNFLFVNQNICKCFTSSGLDSSVTNVFVELCKWCISTNSSLCSISYRGRMEGI